MHNGFQQDLESMTCFKRTTGVIIMLESLMEALRELPRVFIGTTIIYFFIVTAFRLIGKNGISELSLTDFIIILVVSEAANSAILGPSESILASMAAIATLLLWDYITRRLQLRYPKLDVIVSGYPLILVNRGQILKQNLDKADMNESKLSEALRKEGVLKFEEVKLAILEPSGAITVIPYSPDEKK